MNWRKLDDKDYKIVWDRFYSEFKFAPSINKFPAIQTSLPTIKFDIKEVFQNYPEEKLTKLSEIGEKLLIDTILESENLYALDWQHDCYIFNPRLGFSETGIFTPSIIPDGDYYIFITQDFQNIWFGHPWEKTITLIGERIVNKAKNVVDNLKELQINLVLDDCINKFLSSKMINIEDGPTDWHFAITDWIVENFGVNEFCEAIIKQYNPNFHNRHIAAMMFNMLVWYSSEHELAITRYFKDWDKSEDDKIIGICISKYLEWYPFNTPEQTLEGIKVLEKKYPEYKDDYYFWLDSSKKAIETKKNK